MATKKTKKEYLTAKEKQDLVKAFNTFAVKLDKKIESVSAGYDKDFLMAAKKALSVVKYNIFYIA